MRSPFATRAPVGGSLEGSRRQSPLLFRALNYTFRFPIKGSSRGDIGPYKT